jgi:hypothetical protein
LFDEYGYKEDFADEPLIVDYLTFRMKRDLERQGKLLDGGRDGEPYYEVFEHEAKLVYKKMIAAEQFEAEDLSVDSFGIPTEIKVLVREQFREVLTKMEAIVGPSSDDEIGKNPNKDLLQSLPLLDTYSYYEDEINSGYESQNQRFGDIFDVEENKIPFPPTIPIPNPDGEPVEPEKYIVERYVRVSESTDPSLASQQRSSNILGVVNFVNFNEFVEGNKDVFADRKVSDLFEEPLRFGCRLVNVAELPGDALSKTAISSYGKNFALEGSSKLEFNSTVVDHEKSFYVLEKRDVLPPLEVRDDDSGPLSFDDALQSIGVNLDLSKSRIATDLIAEYTEFSSIPISSAELPFDSVELFKDLEGLEKEFDKKYRSSLFELLAQDEDTRLLFEYCFAPKRLTSLLYLHSTMTLNSEEMRLLFEGTKRELKKLFETLLSMGDYLSNKDMLDGIPGNAAAYKKSFDDIGSPSGPSGPDAFYYHTITPIMILRGLAELTDPNIAITAKIVAAGNAGYLLPKFEGNHLGLVETPSPDPDGESTFALPTIEYTDVSVLDPNNVSVKLSASMPNIPSWAIDSTRVLVPGASGILVPDEPDGSPGLPPFVTKLRGGENRTEFDAQGRLSLYGLRDGQIVKSEPVFPGTPINLPYNLVSLALLPLNKMWPIVGPFCGPPTTMTGDWFLNLEPLIYQLPNFKITRAAGDVAEIVKKEHNLDLNASKKFKCEDNTEPEDETS